MKNSVGGILLSSILTVSGILVVILNMFHENIPAYVGLGMGLVGLGVIVHYGSSSRSGPES
ncbi:MAG: hypothetical protein KGY55_03170 [Candidatus Thermoplasmatota archaeon]|nr:hypothetical protein [Candidatus Thermoplasmatota archaeon]